MSVNTLRDSIQFILAFYSSDSALEWMTIEDFIEVSPLRHFVPKLPMADLVTLLSPMITEMFGHRAIQRRGKNHTKQVLLKCLIDWNETRFMAGWRTDNILSHEEFDRIPSGSKVIFRQIAPLGFGNELYLHTALLIRRDGRNYLLEVTKRGGGDRKTKLVINSLEDLQRSGQMEGDIYVDNRYLAFDGSTLDLRDLIYRASQIIERPISYDARNHNCDTISTYLVTGRNDWVTRNCLCWRVATDCPKCNIYNPLDILRPENVTPQTLTEVEYSSERLPRLAIRNVIA